MKCPESLAPGMQKTVPGRVRSYRSTGYDEVRNKARSEKVVLLQAHSRSRQSQNGFRLRIAVRNHRR